MKVMNLQEIKYSDFKKALTYEFVQDNLYAICCDSFSKEDPLGSLFQVMSLLKSPNRGEVFWKNVNVKKLSPSLYRSNMVTIIDKNNIALGNMRVFDFLKYSTDDFKNLYVENMEYIDYLELIYILVKEFGFDKKKMKLKIKNLTAEERWQLKIVESLLKGSELLLINKTLDSYKNELQEFCFDSLRQMIKKYNQCVVIFTEKREIAFKTDYLIDI